MKAYFSHDEGARNDPKLVAVLMELGHEGKSVYWDLVEMLYEQGGYLELAQCRRYAFALHTQCDLILRLVNEFGLFAADGESFWSETALDRMKMRDAKKQARAEAGAKGGKVKAEKEAAAKAMLQQNPSNAIANAGNAIAIKRNESKVNTTEVVAPATAPVYSPLDEDEPTFDFASSFFNTDKWLAVVADVQKTARYAEADFGHYRDVIRLADDTAPQVLPNRHWRKKLMNWLENDAASKNGIVKPVATSQPKGRGENEMTFELNPTAVARRRREAEEMERTIVAANLARINRNEGTNFTVAGVLGKPTPA